MSNHPITSPRAVAFSKFSKLSIISKDETDSKWYSMEDEHRFRRALIRDSIRMKRRFDAAPVDGVPLEHLYECLGIESKITQGLAQLATIKRHNHSAAVLSEQRHQKMRGIHDPERLANVSKRASLWAKQRAQKLAKGYSELLE
mmetsp:Transcript_35405/g.60149  ORF Transcript_35405/g.60149 Transcript_35405/m.60149 type:complete len:144 (+) Transcript_35405:297-728(+)